MLKTLEEVFTSESVQTIDHFYKEVMSIKDNVLLNTNKSCTLELTMKHKTGFLIPVEVRYSLLTGPDGLPSEILGVARDVTERKQVDEELWIKTLEALIVLSFAHEAKGRYTAGHSGRVTDIAMAIGKRLSLNEEELMELKLGSLLHDIGKIAVKEPTINKPGKLTKAEYEHVMTHPIVGASIVRPVTRSKNIIDIIEYHHSSYDGTGYNQKLRGENICLLARIVALADAYDAMTSARSYRPALSRDEALSEIRRGIRRQFDPVVAEVFLGMSATDILPRKRKILIADDEASTRLLVRSVLGNEYTIIEASDGLKAVEVAQSQQPSLIFMDVLMPAKDGLQACYEIKANLATKAIPVVMLTGIGGFDMNRKFAADLGADGYITKPFTANELLFATTQFLKGAPSSIKSAFFDQSDGK